METVSEHKLERLEYFLKGDKHALLFCLDLLYVCHCWDDLIDRDKERSGEDINQAFIKSLAGIPGNPFYQQCMPALLPMIYNALTMWLESNKLKTGGRDKRVTAYALDNAIIEIVHFCILVKGTIEWAREVADEFWELFGPTAIELEECLGDTNE